MILSPFVLILFYIVLVYLAFYFNFILYSIYKMNFRNCCSLYKKNDLCYKKDELNETLYNKNYFFEYKKKERKKSDCCDIFSSFLPLFQFFHIINNRPYDDSKIVLLS